MRSSLTIALAYAVAAACLTTGWSKSSLAQNSDDKKSTPGVLTLVNEAGAVTTLSSKDFAKLPRRTMQAKDHSGVQATYEGVDLAELLRVARVTMGSELKGPRLANFILVEAQDGYRVVFSLPEVDPGMTDNWVLVADSKDGKPLDAKEAPYRLVVPQDKKHARWVRQVTQISIRTVGETAPQTPNKPK